VYGANVRQQGFIAQTPRARLTGPALLLATLVLEVPADAHGAHQALGGRPPFAVEVMLRIYCLQLWWNPSDPAMEEELHERPLYRRFAGLVGASKLPDETTILRFRHLLEKHSLTPEILKTINAGLTAQGLMLRTGTLVDATLIAAPSSTKNSTGTRDPEMHQTKKGNQWHFGMKAHIGVDAESGLVHTVIGTAANVSDITQAAALLHGEETDAFADAGYQGVAKREQAQDAAVNWHVALRPGKRRALDKNRASQRFIDELETIKARIRAKVEHPFRVIKQQFGFAKVRYRGLAKNTARLNMLFAMSNLWMARNVILQAGPRPSMA
jgi:IS5 family transposase